MARTENQQKAIDFEKGNVAVTASAGSGKTSVMIDRFIRLVLEKKAEVKEVLAVTFTRLAAAELKERLAKAIRENLANKQDVKYLKKQLDELPAANISTVHSFCSSVIKRYFYLVGVEANFAIAEDEAVEDIKNLAISALFDDLYEAEDEDFLSLLRIFSKSRKDKGLRTVVLDLYNYASSEEDDERFLRASVELYTEENHKIAEEKLLTGIIEKLRPFIEQMKEYAPMLSPSKDKKYIEYMSGAVAEFERFAGAPTDENIALCFGAKRRKPSRSKKDSELITELGALLERYKDVFDKQRDIIDDVFCVDSSERTKRTLSSGEVMRKLVDLTLKFKERFQAEKTERGVLDYSDLEHKTFEILKNEEACKELAESFKYIFVDEYQDTNGIQEAIFRLLARDNLFIVGDIKQSIYGFRGSDPTIFERRLTENETIELQENFRSTETIVNAVNKVFCRVMKGGAVDYAKSPMKYGGLYPNERGYAAIEYVAKDKKGDAEGDAIKGVYGIKKHLECKKDALTCGRHALVKKIIEDNVGTKFIDRKGNERYLGYGDIMIVSRTNSYGDILSELIRSGIPVTSEAEVSIEEYYEINLMADILTTVYTLAKDDLALISVLKSPIVSLKDEDLLKIRNANREGDFHSAVRAYAEGESDETAQKLKGFYEYLKRIKLLSSAEGCGKLLRRIVEEKHIDLDILSMPCGKARISRLDRFLNGLKLNGEDVFLSEFIEKKDILMQRSTASASGGEDSVSIMTIHKSKGLEAPVVIVVGLDHSIHKGHLKESIYKNRKLGFGLDYYDVENKTKEPTVVKKYIAQENSKQALAEEARLLYVALTRAEVRLFVVTDSGFGENKAEPENIFDFFTADDMEYIERTRDEVMSATALTERDIVLPPPDEKLKNEIAGYLDFVYPFEGDITLPLKRTVTELNALSYESEPITPLSPVFSADVGDIEHGNAYHKFLELCSLDKARLTEDLGALSLSGAMNEEDLAILDKEKLARILALDIFDKIKDYDKFREQPFIVNIPPELAGESGSSEILLQGVIDLLAVKGEEAVVIDYKFSVKDDDALKERYKKQLELYSFAVEKVTGLKVVGKYLVNLLKERVVEV